MSESLATRKTVARVDVVRHEGAIMLPTKMKIPEAVLLLQEHEKHAQQVVSLSRDFEAFPHDGAAALQRVLTKKYGFVPAQPTPGFFRDNPPELISIETSLGKVEQVAWGKFALPGIEGSIQTGANMKSGRFVFVIAASIKRMYEDEIQELFELVQAELKAHSIYRGKAIRIRFLDDNGDKLAMPEVSFMPTDVKRENLIFARDLEASIETNLFTPIERALDCKRNGISVKRGVLLGGPYGTGKTLAAAVAASIAVENGITYIYVPRADELHQAIAFARQYDDPACVIFCEDIDRVMAGERTAEMDDILNIIDGIDGKRSNIVVVLTTNFLENINKALLRPGRLDAVINVTAPDAEAVERLLRAYGGGTIAAEDNLTAVGKQLAGQIPAVIAEVVKRAKLAQLRRTATGEQITHISAEALLEAAKTMTAQVALLAPSVPQSSPTIDSLIREAAGHGAKIGLNGGHELLESTKKRVEAIAARVGA